MDAQIQQRFEQRRPKIKLEELNALDGLQIGPEIDCNGQGNRSQEGHRTKLKQSFFVQGKEME